jgi:hypothetical protein
MREPIELKCMFKKWGREPLEPNYGAYKPNPSKFKPRKLVYNHTRADNEAPPPPDFGGGYEELGMDTEPTEPWDFGDTPSKPRYYWNKRDLLQSAQEGEPRAFNLLLTRWLITGSQYLPRTILTILHSQNGKWTPAHHLPIPDHRIPPTTLAYQRTKPESESKPTR